MYRGVHTFVCQEGISGHKHPPSAQLLFETHAGRVIFSAGVAGIRAEGGGGQVFLGHGREAGGRAHGLERADVRHQAPLRGTRGMLVLFVCVAAAHHRVDAMR